MATLPQDIKRHIPFLISICDLLTTSDCRRLFVKADRKILQVRARAVQRTFHLSVSQILVETAINLAVRGVFQPSNEIWQQLRTNRHRNCIRQLVSTKAIGTWRQLLSRHVDTARLLAQAVIERDRINNRSGGGGGEESGDE